MIVMSIMVKSVNFDDYQKTQTNYKDTNFLQSAEMAKLQLSRNHIGEVEALVFERDGLIVGQTIIVYRRSFRIFRKALLLHGPLLDYNSITDLPDLLEALILYLKKKNIASLSIHPYLTNLIRNEELEILEEGKADEVSKVFEKLGFEQYLDPEQALVVNQMFVKPIDTFTTSDEMLAAFLPSFFQDLKRNFGKSAKFMLAYLDCPAYLAYLDENIKSFETRIQALKDGPQKKRTKGQIADAQDQLRSYYKRLEQFKTYQITGDKLPLSAYLFMDYGSEVVSFYGGNDEAYLNFGGAVLLHWEMLQYAMRKGKERFNFYGTIETEAASTGKGNFHFKRQFGGQLETLVGSFDKTLNPFYDIFKKTLGKD